jgi:hypothetical protein
MTPGALIVTKDTNILTSSNLYNGSRLIQLKNLGNHR